MLTFWISINSLPSASSDQDLRQAANSKQAESRADRQAPQVTHWPRELTAHICESTAVQWLRARSNLHSWPPGACQQRHSCTAADAPSIALRSRCTQHCTAALKLPSLALPSCLPKHYCVARALTKAGSPVECVAVPPALQPPAHQPQPAAVMVHRQRSLRAGGRRL